MNAFLVFLLQPPENPLSRIQLSSLRGDNLKEFDFIQHYFGKEQGTRTWNEYGLKRHNRSQSARDDRNSRHKALRKCANSYRAQAVIDALAISLWTVENPCLALLPGF